MTIAVIVKLRSRGFQGKYARIAHVLVEVKNHITLAFP